VLSQTRGAQNLTGENPEVDGPSFQL